MSIDFSLEARQGTTLTFDTAIGITTDLVNDECAVTDGNMLYSLRRSCLVHTADSCEEGRFSCDNECVLANVNFKFNFAICYRRSVCRLSVCDAGAPYSAG